MISSKCKFLAILALQALFAQAATANVIVNGDFSSGNSGFSSQYTYNASNATAAGVYSIQSNPQDVHSLWIANVGAPPTGSGGLMMVVNGAGTVDVPVWMQNVNLVAGQQYVFEGWASSVYSGVAASLEVQLSETVGACGTAGLTFSTIGQIQTTTVAPEWVQNVGSIVQRAAAGSYCLQIVNLQTAFGGNDFVIDDLSLAPPAGAPIVGQVSSVPALQSISLLLLTALLAGVAMIQYRHRGAKAQRSE